MDRIPMTVQGYQQLSEEVEKLKKIDRPRVITAIAEARDLGDLSENAEYQAAKEQQSFLEGRIAEIESKLAMAQVIDISTLPHEGRVIFGVTVDLLNLNTNKKVTYTIVGDEESDISQSKISVNSPLARSLIGKSEGDVVIVSAPAGEIEYEIKKVRY